MAQDIIGRGLELFTNTQNADLKLYNKNPTDSSQDILYTSYSDEISIDIRISVGRLNCGLQYRDVCDNFYEYKGR